MTSTTNPEKDKEDIYTREPKPHAETGELEQPGKRVRKTIIKPGTWGCAHEPWPVRKRVGARRKRAKKKRCSLN